MKQILKAKAPQFIMVVVLFICVLGVFVFLNAQEAQSADDYAQYANVDFDTASLELIEEIAFLEISDTPESMRDTILQARDVLRNNKEWWDEHNLLYQITIDGDFWHQDAWLIGESEAGGFAFGIFVELDGTFEEFPETGLLQNAGKTLTEVLVVEPEFSEMFPDCNKSPTVPILDYSAMTPKKYEVALEELKQLLKQAYGDMETNTLASTAQYAQYAEIDIETAPSKLIGEIAYLDINTAPESLKETILQARSVIIFSTGWVTDDPENHGSFHSETSERFFIPKFSDLFPDWDLPNEIDITTGEMTSAKSSSFHTESGHPPYYVLYYEGRE